MRRFSLSLAAGAVLFTTTVRAQSPDEIARTSAYVAALQNRDGGFSTKAGEASSLPATSSAIRILKNIGGSVPDVLGCVKYVQSCHDAESGGYAPMPGGKPEVRTTAVGLMAAAELKIPADSIAPGAVAYFSKTVKSFEDIRIAVAGLEAVTTASPDFPAWTKQVEAGRNAAGAFGEGPGEPRATGSAAVALLRMGVKLDNREAVLTAVRAGQALDGGWSKDAGPSDLETTYRVMRLFFMLKESPDLEKVRGFIARCRHSDGAYSVKEGGPSDLGGIYFATTVARWVRLLSGEPALLETAGFVPLFNGKDLAGWEGDKSLWSARDGMIEGTSTGLKHNDFLATEASYGDFILKLMFRLSGSEQSNSGVQFRSVRVPGHEMSGYQADIGNKFWGCLYDESRRNKTLAPASEKALKALNPTGWNQYVIHAAGGRIRLSLNGVQSVDYQEADPAISRTGRIALQIHAGGPMVIQFKDILIQQLPTPTAEKPTEPGFHLRTLKTEKEERKYAVFVPNGYDGSKAFPAVLFLHGSGGRGEDGVIPTQTGLGPAIYGHPGDFPAIAVFPQARTSWKADSDDLKAALAVLDDVLASYKVDRRRVVLTGLSMGGAGSWALAAMKPERFAAVIPVCGNGDPEKAAVLKTLPIWGFVGDADSDRAVLNLREMTTVLRSAGADARETEYRGVGHNSWDRTYNDPALIDWMLAQVKR